MLLLYINQVHGQVGAKEFLKAWDNGAARVANESRFIYNNNI